MRWRRLLWSSMSALLAWGLYLHLPAKPRWTLPEYEVPLKANARRMATMVLDPDKHDRPTSQPNDFDDIGLEFGWRGPVRLRDATTGRVLGELQDDDDAWSSCRISSDFRFVLCSHFDRDAIAVYGFETGSRWSLAKVGHAYFSPKGTLVHAWLENHDQLLDSATGRVIAEFAPDYRFVYRIAADDSWGLFVGSDENDVKTRWFIWHRDQNAVSQGDFTGLLQGPGHKQGFQFAPDGRTAAVQLFNSNSYRLLLWDILRGAPLHELKSSVGEGAALEFSPDGKMLAVWSRGANALELFEIASGKRRSIKTAAGIVDCTFSRDGKLFSYVEGDFPQTLVVTEVPEPKERWRNRTETDLISPVWLKSEPGRLLTRKSGFGNRGAGFSGGGFGATGAVVHNGETGQELFSRPQGELSSDSRILIRAQSTAEEEARGPFGTILHWLPWFKSKEFLTVTAERLDDGREVFRRAIMHSADEAPPETHSPYCDGNTLVLMCAGRDTEIWDLPPARRWGWILGPPAAIAALPWVWRRARRGSNKGALTVVATSAESTRELKEPRA